MIPEQIDEMSKRLKELGAQEIGDSLLMEITGAISALDWALGKNKGLLHSIILNCEQALKRK